MAATSGHGGAGDEWANLGADVADVLRIAATEASAARAKANEEATRLVSDARREAEAILAAARAEAVQLTSGVRARLEVQEELARKLRVRLEQALEALGDLDGELRDELDQMPRPTTSTSGDASPSGPVSLRRVTTSDDLVDDESAG